MFSNTVPFHQINQELRVVMSVLKGARPARPSHALSIKRGLDDEVWRVIEACWAQKPSERPTAARVVEQFQSLPNRPSDQRPFDGPPPLTPSQVVYQKIDHPFAALAPSNEDGSDLQDLKWISGHI